MKNTALFVFLSFVAALPSFAQEAFRITHGPYLQALDESGVTIVWTTNRKGIGYDGYRT